MFLQKSLNSVGYLERKIELRTGLVRNLCQTFTEQRIGKQCFPKFTFKRRFFLKNRKKHPPAPRAGREREDRMVETSHGTSLQMRVIWLKRNRSNHPTGKTVPYLKLPDTATALCTHKESPRFPCCPYRFPKRSAKPLLAL